MRRNDAGAEVRRMDVYVDIRFRIARPKFGK
jgi:hypothetical protein